MYIYIIRFPKFFIFSYLTSLFSDIFVDVVFQGKFRGNEKISQVYRKMG